MCDFLMVAQTVKCLPTMRETWLQSLGWEDLLEKEMATHSSILAWKIPWTEEPGRLQSMGSQRIRTVCICIRKRNLKKKVDIYVYIIESFCYIPETNTIVNPAYFNKKRMLFFKKAPIACCINKYLNTPCNQHPD